MQSAKILFIRELYMVYRNLKRTAVDSAVVTSMHLLSLKYFLPAMGMDPQWQVSLFLGYVHMLCFTVGYVRGIDITADIESRKFVAYQCALPAGKRSVLMVYVLGFMLNMLAIVVPVVSLGLFVLQGSAVFPGSILGALGMLVLNSVFFALLFITISFWFTPDRYFDSVWPRVLGPLFVFGGIFYTWSRIFSLSPRVSYLFLWCPVLYCTEGIRGALLADNTYLSTSLCVAVVSASCVVLYKILLYAVARRIDPVEER